ncbi:helix-turn-helix transcriptional regulator [Streptomyces sp. NPDC005648]|uniref:helix-turn-helix domain-containing protein n=1 Tax=Streptomyces sp. NPDC005648 TaxID=3157044 RepID=UPI0033A67060
MIGQEIKRLRTERRMTQRQLARAIDVAELAVYRWERGLRQPRIANLQRLAGAFDVPIAALFGDTADI